MLGPGLFSQSTPKSILGKQVNLEALGRFICNFNNVINLYRHLEST